MFACGVPPNLVTFDQIVGVDHSIFGKSSLTLESARELFRVRPEIYSTILCPRGQVVAYSDVYPLKPEWAQLFVAGKFSERSLQPHMILRREDFHEGQHFYVGSVVVNGKFDPVLKSLLLASLLRWRAYHFQALSLRVLTLLMTAVTSEGKRLVNRVGAQKVCSGLDRKDGHDLYQWTTTPAILHDLSTAIDGFLKKDMVRMSFDFR
ncbi:MAG TPA: hypothetical protein VIY51_23190 [Xanthobacteraceae bacterium]